MPVVTGDFSGLKQLAIAMSALGEPPARRELSAVLGEEARTQALIGFQRGVDPYDVKWKPIRYRQGQPLRDTGRLQNSITGSGGLRSYERGFSITTDVFYAATHQYGATIKAKRARPHYHFGSGDMVSYTESRPMLVFKVRGRGGKVRWVSKAQVTVPRRQFMPEGHLGPRWEKGLEAQAGEFLQRKLGRRP